MTTHSKLSPSSRHRWKECPGSVRESLKYPEQPPSKSSIDGTHSHTLLEHCLSRGINSPESKAGYHINRKFTDHHGEFVVDATRAERVQVALDYVSTVADRIYSETGGQYALIRSEERVNPCKSTGRSDLHGTVDIQIHSQDKKFVELIDYKDGMNPVEAKDNAQLEQYALGVIDEHILPQDCVIRMTIIQPKAPIKGLPAVTSHDMTVEEVRTTVAKNIIREAASTDDPNAPLVPGDKQCKYCPAKGGCSALANKAMESVGMMFQPIVRQGCPSHDAYTDYDSKDRSWEYETLYTPDPMSVQVQTSDLKPSLAQQSAEKDPASMTNEELAQLLEAAPLMLQMIEAAKTEALLRAKAGQVVPGHKLVNGPGSRAWIDEGDEMAQKLIRMGIPKGAVYVTKLVSPAQAEKLQWEKRDGSKVTLSEKQLKRMETEYVKKSKGKLTLVPESDPRPAVVIDASPLFQPVEPELPAWLK